MRTLILVLSLAAFVACASTPEGRSVKTPTEAGIAGTMKKVSVPIFSGNAANPAVRATLTTVLCTELAASRKFNVMCEDEKEAVVKSQEVGALMGTCEGEDCAQAVGQAVSADLSVVGSIGKVGDQFVITASLMNSTDKSVVKRVEEYATSENDLVEKARSVGRKLAE